MKLTPSHQDEGVTVETCPVTCNLCADVIAIVYAPEDPPRELTN